MTAYLAACALLLVSSSAVTLVHDEASLHAALASGANIKLQNDIFLTRPVRLITDVAIYGHGYKLDGQNGVSCVIINGTEGEPIMIKLNGLNITRCYGRLSSHGGGLTVQMATVRIENCSIHNNHADFNGGGINVGPGGEVTIVASSILANSAGLWGGGIRVQRGSLKLSQSLVNRNIAGSGGGLDISEAHASEIYGCVISENNATNMNWGVGGGIVVSNNHATLSIQGD